MAKPAGSHCNLACSYCYYLEKADRLYADESRHIMTDELLEQFVRQYIESQTTPDVLFTWHGGETFMRPLSFYRRVVQLQQYYAQGRHIDNCIQTNGTLFTPDWCRFLHDEGWLVGVSIDGPQEWHDTYRRTRSGKPSFREVVRGIEMMNRFGVEWNAMAVVNNLVVEDPIRFYEFFRDQLGCRFLQFAPIVERVVKNERGKELLALPPFSEEAEEKFSGQSEAKASPTISGGAGEGLGLTPFSITPDAWGSFLCTLFDEWVRNDVGEMFVQIFDSTLANWIGVPPGLCTLAPDCGHAGVVEYNGDLYSCDHFVFPPFRLGNIKHRTIYELMNSPQQQAFAKIKRERLPRQCRQCDVLFACHGECPKNRFAMTADGEPGLNYLCRGYHRFFTHVRPYMDYMKNLLDQQKAPALVMDAIRRGEIQEDVVN